MDSNVRRFSEDSFSLTILPVKSLASFLIPFPSSHLSPFSIHASLALSTRASLTWTPAAAPLARGEWTGGLHPLLPTLNLSVTAELGSWRLASEAPQDLASISLSKPLSHPCLEHILSSRQNGQLVWGKKGKTIRP